MSSMRILNTKLDKCLSSQENMCSLLFSFFHLNNLDMVCSVFELLWVSKFTFLLRYEACFCTDYYSVCKNHKSFMACFKILGFSLITED